MTSDGPEVAVVSEVGVAPVYTTVPALPDFEAGGVWEVLTPLHDQIQIRRGRKHLRYHWKCASTLRDAALGPAVLTLKE